MSAPNNFGSNLTKAIIVLPIDDSGEPVGPDNPSVVEGANTAGAPQSEDVLDVQGHGYQGTFTVTRGANTTPYTGGDVVGGVLTIAGVGPDSGDVLLTSLRLLMNITAIPSGMSSFSLQLYGSTPPSAIADNDPWTLGSGDRSAYIGHIDNLVPQVLGTGTTSVQAQLTQIVDQVRIVSGGQLFAYLVTVGGFTPANNSETYTGRLRSVLP
jgi:hypothetical protein